LTFNDLGAVVFEKDKPWKARDGGMPYDATRDPLYRGIDDNDFAWDELSVGITLVEVFFGTDVVAALSSMNVVHMLLRESRIYLDESANGVLLQLF
jgi:hypothetical protein